MACRCGKVHKLPLVSPLTRDEAPRPDTDRTAGSAVAAAANRKRCETYPELAVARRCKLVEAGIEVVEVATFLRKLAVARAGEVPVRLRTATRQAFLHRISMLAIAAQRALAYEDCHHPGGAASQELIPARCDAACLVQAPACSIGKWPAPRRHSRPGGTRQLPPQELGSATWAMRLPTKPSRLRSGRPRPSGGPARRVVAAAWRVAVPGRPGAMAHRFRAVRLGSP